jgi:hypothetical protein
MRLAGIAALVAMLVAALPAAAGRDGTKLERRGLCLRGRSLRRRDRPRLIGSPHLESFERQLGDQVQKNA